MSTDPQNPDKALLDRLESRLGGEQPAAAPNADPLSELARLIGDASGGQPPAPQAPAPAPQQQPYPDPSGFNPAAQPFPGAAQPAPQAGFPDPGAHPGAPPPPQPAAPPASNLESDIAAQLAQSLQSMDFGSAAPGFSQPPERQGFALDAQPAAPPAQPPVPPPANPELADLYGHQQPLNLRQPQTGAQSYPGQPQAAGNAVHFDAAAPNFQPAPGSEGGFEGAAAHAAAQAGYAEQGFAPDGTEQGFGEQGYPVGQAGDEFPDTFADYDAEPEQGKSRRGILVVGTVLALVVVGAASVFGYRAIVGGGEPVPTIRAADGDSRALPEAEQPAGDQNKLVYERINGTGTDGQAQLVPREEDPAVAPADRQIRVVTGGQGTAEDGDATRTVRTFSVSPDGQIVRNPEPEPAPQPESVVPAAPPAPPQQDQVQQATIQPAPVQQAPAAVTQPQPSQVATQVTAQPPQVQPAPVAVPQPQPGPVVLNQQTNTAAAPVVTPAPVVVQPQPTVQPPAIAPVVNPLAQQQQTRRFVRGGSNNDDPLAETLGQSAQVPQQQQVAVAPQPQTITLPPAQAPQAGQAVPQAVAPQAAAPQQQGVSLPFGAAGGTTQQAAASGGSVVQIASSRSEGDARAAISRAQQRFGAIVGNYQPSVARSDLGTRGIFYRASFGPMSRAEATDVCNRLKARGGDCFVRATGG